MVERIGGSRRKSKHKFRKDIRQKGKISISEFLKELKIGQAVVLKADPAYQKGFYHSRFHGKRGKIVEKKGSCYSVEINDKGKLKHLIVHPVHLKAM